MAQRIGSARDIPGRKREYETIYIMKPDVSTETIGQVNTKVRQVIDQGGGTALKLDNWGKRKLAFEVRKQLRGVYLFWHYLGTAGLVEEIERNLRLLDTVIRVYSVKLAENVDPATRQSELTEESFAKAATPGPDEEEIATGQAGARAFGDDDEGGFDFEEAVFGGTDQPKNKSEKGS